MADMQRESNTTYKRDNKAKGKVYFAPDRIISPVVKPILESCWLSRK